jgi:hypothetical protein
MAIGVFAGIPVRDYNSAAQWYQQLFGSKPAFYPNDIEAVWMMAEDRYVYIVQAPDRAGGAANMVWIDSLAKEIERIAERGLTPADIEIHGDVRKYVYRDADGNETGMGGNWIEPG